MWNLTESEHRDGRTRFCILKGGARHVAEGSDWYFDGGLRGPEFSAKYLVPGLGWLGRDSASESSGSGGVGRDRPDRESSASTGP